MSLYNIVIETNESTVVSEYQPQKVKSDAFQSEQQLEKEFIRLLQEQGYEYTNIHNEKALILNLRKQIQKLNNIEFNDNEWNRFFSEKIANKNDGMIDKTKKIQWDDRVDFKFDKGNTVNVVLIDKKRIHENSLQVINQFENNDGSYKNRYDVTILVNGFPLVHIELKRRGIELKEAFNQINRYQRESFWAASGLFQYIQIFVISNGTNTKYYSNSVWYAHTNDKSTKKKNLSKSFDFTSFWADAKNQRISDLIDFTKTFFSKHSLLNVLTKYCVFTEDKNLLVMRPYQIVAAERIINRINISNNYKDYSRIESGGYIWHTTGSGKTLTSFKTAQLATKLDYIDKVLFVVDRKDLDYQTMREYDRFQEGAANSSSSTDKLRELLEKPDAKIIITTIQKLNNFIKNNKGHPSFQKHVVIIFDECHRSQFGQMNLEIRKAFKKHHLFGFTGTPIFAANSNLVTAKGSLTKTTEQTFGDCLHKYTIIDAINDKNVLPFKVDFIKTMHAKDEIEEKQIYGVDEEKVILDPERVKLIVQYILENFERKTCRTIAKYVYMQLTNVSEISSTKNKFRDDVKETRKKTILNGFNSIFCVSNINAAKAYYEEFQKQMEQQPKWKLNVATIFSFAPNEELDETLMPEENSEDTSALDKPSKDFLQSAISDYNKIFKTNYGIDNNKFQNYYKDVSMRMKNREIDILIVVNMFLTGFDAKTLNTLWVDKNLNNHGLIQAFSRTNRILDPTKAFGNIVCFRTNLEEKVEQAIALFGNKNAKGICLLKSYNDYYNGFIDDKNKYHTGYLELINNLKNKYPIGKQIVSEAEQKDFIKMFSLILKTRNILVSFDEFKGNEILTEREFQDYQSTYNDFYLDYKEKREKHIKEDITDDIVFEIELIKQIEINIDYIMELVDKYCETNKQNKDIYASIETAINSSLKLRNKKQLIISFINQFEGSKNSNEAFFEFAEKQKQAEFNNIIANEKLKEEKAWKYINNAFRDDELKVIGTDVDEILPPMSRFQDNREFKKNKIIEKIKQFFEKYRGIVK